jgi:uncharacterized repeat protein (TIGR03806 family)
MNATHSNIALERRTERGSTYVSMVALISALVVALLGVAGCSDDNGLDGSPRPVSDTGADTFDATSSDVADTADTSDFGDVGDTDDTNDTGGVIDGPGLDMRPSNTTCVAPERPASNSAIELERAFANLSFSKPVWMEQPPGDGSRWYVISQNGTIETFANDPQVAAAQTALSFDDGRVVGGGERGLLGMAFHPDWPATAELFISYTTSVGGQLTSRISKVSARDDGVTFEASTEQVIFEVDQPAGNHNGGQIGFGPDGYLYISFGDGGGGGDTYGNGQNKDTVLGALLRIDVLGAEQPYAIPPDNPFADGGGAPEIYAWGLRNVWRFSWDRQTGQLWAGDVGQNAWEEIDRVELGGNYGWPAKEGTHCFDVDPCEAGPWIDPVVEYAHQDNNRSVTGGYVYRGDDIPALKGHYIFADYASGRIWQVVSDPETGEPAIELMLETGMSISSFAEDNDGELYVVGYAGQLYRVVDSSTGESNDDFPRLLSETGCVDPDDPTAPAAGLIPFAPNAPFWSDGASKRRWMAVPDGLTIQVEDDGDWTFPAGTVLVKSFEIDGALIETRLFIHHDDGWAGYSYEWNDAQTDAELVEGGKRKDLGDQEWIFPSGGDCLTCHTQAAGFALGPETAQLNGAVRYRASGEASNGRRANQLETLRHIGLLDGLPAGDPEVLPVIPDPFGDAPQTDRARAYLHTNCAQCHRPNTASVRFPFDTRFGTPFVADDGPDTDLCDVEPGGFDLGVDDARRIAPGQPSKSLVYLRMQRRDAHGMPPLGSTVVDTQGAELLSRWIESLNGCVQ